MCTGILTPEFDYSSRLQRPDNYITLEHDELRSWKCCNRMTILLLLNFIIHVTVIAFDKMIFLCVFKNRLNWSESPGKSPKKKIKTY